MATITGTNGDNSLVGGLFGDTITGLGGNDQIDGKGGVDRLIGGTGTDIVLGGSGRDVLVVGDGDTAAGEVYDGGPFNHTDTLEISSSAAAVVGDFEVSFERSTLLSLEMLAFQSAIDVTAIFSAQSFGGANLSDTLVIVGGAATQAIHIRMNGDPALDISGWTFSNWQFSDSIFITGGRLGETIRGSAERDTIDPFTGTDTVDGGGGDDVILIDGASSGDSLDGGLDNDTLLLTSGAADLRGAILKSIEVIEFAGAGAGTQTVTLSAEQFGFGKVASDMTVLLGSEADHTLRITMDDETSFDASDILLLSQNDSVNTFIIEGDQDAEFITGTSSGDIINGGGGQDTLIGGSGDDELDGGLGVDLMIGGAGNDIYVVSDAGDVAAEIFVGTDPGGIDRVISTITATLGTFIENLTLAGAAEIDGTGNGLGNTITGNEAVNVLRGLAGDDVLTGGQGADALAGGGGADRFVFNFASESAAGAGNRDIITGFQGADVIDVSAVDANAALAGNQAFVLDTDGVLETGEFRIATVNGNTVLSFNTNGDSAPEMQILLEKVTGITAGDFLL